MDAHSMLLNKSVLREMKFIGVFSIIFFLFFAWLSIAFLIHFQIGTNSSLLGSFIGGVSGIYIVYKMTYKTHTKISKFKMEMNKIYNKYKNQYLAYILTIIYLLLVTCIIVIIDNPMSFDVIDLLDFVFLNTVTTALLFLGVGYTSAWLNYKKTH